MIEQVADRVYRLNESIVNFYVAQDADKVTVIDSGVRAHWKLLLGGLQELGLDASAVEAVLLTHAHMDHIGFAETARTKAGATVYVHSDDLDLALGKMSPKRERGFLGYNPLRVASLLWFFATKGAFSFPKVTLASTFSDGETLDVPGKPRVIHAPGHTAGSCALLLEERGAVCTGDAIVTDNVMTGRLGPQIAPGAFNVDSGQAMESLSRLEGITAKNVLPGHGVPFTGGLPEAIRLARAAGVS